MTVDELIAEVNTKFGNSVETRWPDTYEVDYETYINVCHKVFELSAKEGDIVAHISGVLWTTVAIGPNYRIMFKNMELIPVKERADAKVSD